MGKNVIVKFLKAHWIPLVVIIVLSVALRFTLEFNIFLSFFILLVAYFLIGMVVEYIMERMGMKKGKQYVKNQQSSQNTARANAVRDRVADKQPQPTPTYYKIPTDASPDESKYNNDNDKAHIVLQKKNQPDLRRPRLEKVEKTRAEFVDDMTTRHTSYGAKARSASGGVSRGGGEVNKMTLRARDSRSAEFIERTSEMYRRNTERNTRTQKSVNITIIENANDIKYNDDIQDTSVSPSTPDAYTPDTYTFVMKRKEAPSETPEVISRPEEIEQISQDISREVDKRLSDDGPHKPRRRYRADTTKSAPEINVPFLTDETNSEPIITREKREAVEIKGVYDDDNSGKVHVDQRKLDDLFSKRSVRDDMGLGRSDIEDDLDYDEFDKRNETGQSNQSDTTNRKVPMFPWLNKRSDARSDVRSDARADAPRGGSQLSPSYGRVYEAPSTDLLRGSYNGSNSCGVIDVNTDPRARRLINTLESFGVGARVTAVIRGPAVTRYELQPNPGVKVSRIVSLSDDISLNLAATGVRIEAPIPGKEAVGIEVPNKEVEIVYLRDVIESSAYRDSQSKLSFAIGKDIAGQSIVADIAKMPHLLIAGATGAGKSVCINTIIASILYKAGPDEVRMIMIDPKIVELGVYNGIPHLLVPVVTNPKKAAAALSWAVGEMERRYNDFSQYNVRDIKSFNALCRKKRSLTPMPQIVIIIDELADLMMVAAKEIEDSIIRLAQKARAAGIHIVIATQRPSVDVITGLIKANIPSRIAFAVSSQIDSRTILDGAGAEKLLGRGDMLFHPMGMSKPLRVQGAFVSDGEIESLVQYIRDSYGEASYSDEVQATMEAKASEAAAQNGGAGRNGTSNGDNDDDCDAAVIDSAAELALEYKQLSTSFLQRKLKIGYSRASRVVDTLEAYGLVSAADGSKPRRVLMTKEEWENVRNNS